MVPTKNINGYFDTYDNNDGNTWNYLQLWKTLDGLGWWNKISNMDKNNLNQYLFKSFERTDWSKFSRMFFLNTSVAVKVLNK